MIIVKLEGGTGNQFFQYALGRQLEKRNKMPVKFDISGFKDDTLRDYSLDRYRVNIQFATDQEINCLKTKPRHIVWRAVRKLLKTGPESSKTHIREKNKRFNPDILNIAHDVYIEGYWQSEKYFSEVADTIRQELQLKNPIPDDYLEFADKIRKTNSVSLHIRRGDYISDPVIKRKHGVCGNEYFQKSIKTIRSGMENIRIFVFSDDIPWVRSNLKIDQPFELISQPEQNDPGEELRLMSLCKHNIIANSSFSWWGAWLNSNPDKMVIAPGRWLQTSMDTSDIAPKQWIIM